MTPTSVTPERSTAHAMGPSTGPPAGEPMARLPLQLGVAAAWGVARAGISLFPGLVWTGAWLEAGWPLFASAGWQPAALRLALAALGAFPLAHAGSNLRAALRTRASDLLVHPDAVVIDGGRCHGARVAYAELTRPYVDVEKKTEKRLSIVRMATFALPGVRTIFRDVPVTRLVLFPRGARLVLAESDRAVEAESFQAARATIHAVAEGRRYIEQAPAVAARSIACPMCGAAVVPEDAAEVVCKYCQTRVALDGAVRERVAAVVAMEESRQTEQKLVAKLLVQERAGRANAWLLVFTAWMLAVWPMCLWLIASRAGGGLAMLAPIDVVFMPMPIAAVLGGFFLTRARLAGRGAFQLLTLGFGALAARREGEPPRCRCCLGPLSAVAYGSVTHCRYCEAQNIVGVDLRPTVDRARTSQKSLGPALRRRTIEKVRWGVGSGVALVLLVLWGSFTYGYATAALDVPAWAAKWPWERGGWPWERGSWLGERDGRPGERGETAGNDGSGAGGGPSARGPGGGTGPAGSSSAGWHLPFDIGSYEVAPGCSCARGSLAVREKLSLDAITSTKRERRFSYRWQEGGNAVDLAVTAQTALGAGPRDGEMRAGAERRQSYGMACEGKVVVIVGEKAATGWSMADGSERWTTILSSERAASRAAASGGGPSCEPLAVKMGIVSVPMHNGRSVAIRIVDGRIAN